VVFKESVGSNLYRLLNNTTPGLETLSLNGKSARIQQWSRSSYESRWLKIEFFNSLFTYGVMTLAFYITQVCPL
jgi:hypothetical protein